MLLFLRPRLCQTVSNGLAGQPVCWYGRTQKSPARDSRWGVEAAHPLRRLFFRNRCETTALASDGVRRCSESSCISTYTSHGCSPALFALRANRTALSPALRFLRSGGHRQTPARYVFQRLLSPRVSRKSRPRPCRCRYTWWPCRSAGRGGAGRGSSWPPGSRRLRPGGGPARWRRRAG